jgi:lipid II:glycine glycyltransferase (peptidoglycan interpeptide bridge formation enzyme)
MPNYLLQWEALRWAQAQGCTVYDWWGAPAQVDGANDPMQGVWQFKQGFGARFQQHIGAWDFPVFLALYRLYSEAMPQIIALWQKRHQGR